VTKNYLSAVQTTGLSERGWHSPSRRPSCSGQLGVERPVVAAHEARDAGLRQTGPLPRAFSTLEAMRTACRALRVHEAEPNRAERLLAAQHDRDGVVVPERRAVDGKRADKAWLGEPLPCSQPSFAAAQSAYGNQKKEGKINTKYK